MSTLRIFFIKFVFAFVMIFNWTPASVAVGESQPEVGVIYAETLLEALNADLELINEDIRQRQEALLHALDTGQPNPEVAAQIIEIREAYHSLINALYDDIVISQTEWTQGRVAISIENFHYALSGLIAAGMLGDAARNAYRKDPTAPRRARTIRALKGIGYASPWTVLGIAVTWGWIYLPVRWLGFEDYSVRYPFRNPQYSLVHVEQLLGRIALLKENLEMLSIIEAAYQQEFGAGDVQ